MGLQDLRGLLKINCPQSAWADYISKTLSQRFSFCTNVHVTGHHSNAMAVIIKLIFNVEKIKTLFLSGNFF